GANSTVLFDQNTAGSFGGAINLTSATFDTAGTTTFSTNTATNNGGAIFMNAGSDFAATGTLSFLNNSVTTDDGGAIYMTGSGTTFTASEDVTFTGNVAGVDGNDSGGAIYALDSSDTDFTGANATILFDQNTAGGDGGAVYVSNSTLDIAGSTTFHNNTAGYGGGALRIADGGDFTITNTVVFSSNTATTTHGGAVNLGNAGTTFTASGDASFTGNTSGNGTGDFGGAVYMRDAATMNFTGANSTILFDQNSTAGYGGAVYMTDASTAFTAAGNVTFSSNTADNTGAVYLTTSADMNFTGANSTVRFDNNTSTDDGGAVSMNTDSTFDTAATTIFDGNTAGGHGGGLYVINGADFTATNDITFSSNTATIGNGGAILLNSSGTTFTASANATFQGNQSGDATNDYGGAVYLIGNSAMSFTGANSTVRFDDNSTTGLGGAITMTGATFDTAATTVFDSNTSVSRAGALYIFNSADFTSTKDITFSNNTTTAGDGGAIYIANSGSTFVSSGTSTFTNNSADAGLGGAIYMGAGTFVSLDASTSDIVFSGNTDSSGANDIYFAGTGELRLYGANDIYFNGGLIGANTGNVINKLGTGTLYLSGTNNVVGGTLNQDVGTIVLTNTGTLSVDTFVTLASTTFDANNGVIDDIAVTNGFTNVGDININIDADAGTADKITVGNTGFVVGGTLGVAVAGVVTGTETFAILESSTLIGTLDGVSLLSGRASLALDYSTANWIYLTATALATNYSSISGLSHNQLQVANALDTGSLNSTLDLNTVLDTIDNLSDADKKLAFNDLSGSIYANAMTVATLNTGRDHVYAKIDERVLTYNKECYECNKGVKSVWGHMYGANNKFDADENTPGNFKADSFGLVAGWDIYRPSKDKFIGVMLGYGEHEAKQVADKVDIEEFTLGAYGGLFGEKWDFKGFAGLGSQDYEGTRNVAFLSRTAKSDFDGYSLALDLEAGYKKALKEAIELRPFVGFGLGYTAMDAFNETGADSVNLHAKKSDYLRTELRFGANINNGKSERFDWYTEAMIKALPSGDTGEYKATFEDVETSTMTIRGSDQGKALLALGLGGEYDVGKNWSLYTNLRAQNSGDVEGYYGNLGVTYKFCGGGNKCKQKKEEPKKS
ncbi:MAG: autotransporter domain-containing protein, partial [Elusimicrobiaceae bacterium]|nr:autotransporter domain-containing protein [Elusimicrobiaceae bacterium]